MDILDELTDLSGAPPHEVKAAADRAIKEIERLRLEVKEANARAYVMAKEVGLWRSRATLKETR